MLDICIYTEYTFLRLHEILTNKYNYVTFN